MQLISEKPEEYFSDLVRNGELRIQVGPYIYSLQSRLPIITQGLRSLYSDFPLAPRDEFSDYNVSLRHNGPWSRLRREVEFFFDFRRTLGPIQTNQAYAFLEWGMNWCVSVHANEYLKLHAAVVAREKGAIVMPGVPGAGKSTLCAALALSGWRVLSDEHALIPPGSTEVVPLCRPISLKNESIAVIKAFDSNAIFGPVSEDTHKGTVAHMKADLHPDSHNPGRLPVRAMVFPKYSASDPQRLSLRPKSESFILAAYHAFNYSLLGKLGFESMVKLIDAVECYDLVYRDLDWAIKSVDELYARQNTA
jgi:HprK-related kinase A